MPGIKILIIAMFNGNKGNGSFRDGMKDTEVRVHAFKEKKKISNRKVHVFFNTGVHACCVCCIMPKVV